MLLGLLMRVRLGMGVMKLTLLTPYGEAEVGSGRSASNPTADLRWSAIPTKWTTVIKA